MEKEKEKKKGEKEKENNEKEKGEKKKNNTEREKKQKDKEKKNEGKQTFPPWTTFKTPFGQSPSESSVKISAAPGSFSEGFKIIGHPATMDKGYICSCKS